MTGLLKSAIIDFSAEGKINFGVVQVGFFF
jgi:hypothetical protein